MWLNFVQIAFVAGNTYTFVEVLAAMLFLATQDEPSGGLSPSSSMMPHFNHPIFADKQHFVTDCPLPMLQQLYMIGGL